MYKIIGGDKKEYGPVSADQIREWVAEGRANGQTLIKLEGTTDWRPLSEFTELAVPPSSPPAASLTDASATPQVQKDPLVGDAELDIISCIQRGWHLVKESLVLSLAAGAFIIVITILVMSVLGGFTDADMQDMITQQRLVPKDLRHITLVSILTAPVYTVLFAGYFYFFLKLVRRQTPSAQDLFAGFGKQIIHLIVAGWLMSLLTQVGLFFCLIPGIYLSVAWTFASLLVIDRKLNFWNAMELSRKALTRRWLMMFCLNILTVLILLGGVLACCVGLLLAAPVASASLMYAYEDIFGG